MLQRTGGILLDSPMWPGGFRDPLWQRRGRRAPSTRSQVPVPAWPPTDYKTLHRQTLPHPVPPCPAVRGGDWTLAYTSLATHQDHLDRSGPLAFKLCSLLRHSQVWEHPLSASPLAVTFHTWRRRAAPTAAVCLTWELWPTSAPGML